MCISTVLRREHSSSTAAPVHFFLNHDHAYSDSSSGKNENFSRRGDYFIKGRKISFQGPSPFAKSGFLEPDRTAKPPHQQTMKKSLSFPGFGILSLDDGMEEDVTTQELDIMFEPSKKDVSKMSKLQIKEYAQKYKHLETGTNKQNISWYK